MSMKLLFIQPKAGFLLRGTTHPLCRTVMFAATYMKNNGFEVRVINRCTEQVDIRETAAVYSPDMVILFLSLSGSVQDAVDVSRVFRNAGITVVWAELIAELAPEHCIKTGCVDYVLYNESLISLNGLARAIEAGTDVLSVNGLCLRAGEDIVRTPRQPAVNAADIPATDWSLTSPEKCFRRFAGRDKMLYLCASIGCPYACGFCGFSMYDCHKRTKRNIQTVLEEIKVLSDDYGLNAVNFSDELMYFTPEELAEIKSFRDTGGYSFVWGGETRPLLFEREMLKKMYDAGCRWLLFGLETGSEHIRGLVNKELDDEKVRQVIRWCSEIGIETYGSFIIGFPGETEEDLRDTVRFALSLDLDAFLFNYYIPVVSTALYNRMEAEGSYKVDDILTYERMISPDHYDRNFSAVPKKDLAVIKAYFDFITISRNKKTGSGKKAGAEFFKKAVNTVSGYLNGNPTEAVKNIFNAALRAFGVVYYPLFFRKTVKKYGLYNINRKNDMTRK